MVKGQYGFYMVNMQGWSIEKFDVLKRPSLAPSFGDCARNKV
jgi:hypothetical protein